MLCGLAIASDIHARLREAEDLLAFQQLLFGGVIQFGRRDLALLLRMRRCAE
jgi:hypothetical protein